MYPYNYAVKSSGSMQKNTRKDCFYYNMYLYIYLYIYTFIYHCSKLLKISIVSQNSAVHDAASFQHAGTFFTCSGE